MSWVYFTGCQNSAGEMRVKIGFTRRHPVARMLDFQPGSPEELDVLAFVPGDIQLERLLHSVFAGVRLHNEWFLAQGCLLNFVHRLMRDGGGARSPISWDAFKLALFECVYDVVPDRVPDGEDWRIYDVTADTDPLDCLFDADYCRAHWVKVR